MLLPSLCDKRGGVVSVVVSWISSILEHLCNVVVIEQLTDWCSTLANQCFECCLQIRFFFAPSLMGRGKFPQGGLRLCLPAVGEHPVGF